MNQFDAPFPYREPDEGAPPSSFGSYLDALYDNRRLIAGIAASMLVLGTAYAILAEPVYRADILVQVEENTTSAKSMLGDISSMFDVKAQASSEMEVLRSRLVSGRVVDGLQLYIDAKPRYLPLLGRWLASRSEVPSQPLPFGYVHGAERISVAAFSVPDALHGKPFVLTRLAGPRYRLEIAGLVAEGSIGVPLTMPTRHGPVQLTVAAIEAEPGADFILRCNSQLATTERLRESLKIAEKGKQSDVIGVTLDGADPQRTAAILNAIGTEYVRQNVQRKSEEAERSIQFLNAQLPELKTQLGHAESRFNAYRARQGTLNLDEEATALLQRSVDAQTRMTGLRQKRDEMLARFMPDHPAVKAIDAQIATAQAELAGIDGKTRALPPIEQEVLRLQRDVQVGTELYTNLLNTQEQLRLVKAGKVGNVRLVDSAAVPELPVRPKRALVIGGSLVLGLMIGMGIAFGRRRMFDSIEDPGEVERFAALPVYASIPHSREEVSLTRLRRVAATPSRELILANRAALDPALESLRSFRTALDFAMADLRNRVVFITGPTPGIGKSFIALNLAAVLGGAGKRVLLVDTDMRRSGMNRIIQAERGAGFLELLRGTHELAQVVRPEVLKGVDYISPGSHAENASDELFDADLRAIFAAMSAAYDIVICDGAPILPVPDAVQLAGYAGVSFVVVRQGVTKRGEIRESLRRLRQVGVAPRGLIFNGLRPRPGNYAYGYGQYRYARSNYSYDEQA
ncbi:GNVR domain-containing protein [Burkholderia gladioli]|uniref:GNVR domain-containing protein n=2 Tax=Burkholderia gladioli TaxID=28095 RepID=UPI000F521338|nr:GNVR domain-containing protein [Burkholderia gladioli]